jgi:hypothetical protein
MPFNSTFKTTTIEAVPNGLLSMKYAVNENEIQIGEIERKMFSLRSKGILSICEKQYSVFRSGLIRGIFVMESENMEKVADVARISVWGNKYEVNYAGHQLTLKFNVFKLKKMYSIYENGIEIGFVGLKKTFSRAMLIEITEDIPKEVSIFILWLVMTLVAASQAGASSAT